MSLSEQVKRLEEDLAFKELSESDLRARNGNLACIVKDLKDSIDAGNKKVAYLHDEKARAERIIKEQGEILLEANRRLQSHVLLIKDLKGAKADLAERLHNAHWGITCLASACVVMVACILWKLL